MLAATIDINPDCWQFEQDGAFKCHNDKADYLQSHADDPYWLAQKLMGTGPRKKDGTLVSNHNELFLEMWKACREVMGYSAVGP